MRHWKQEGGYSHIAIDNRYRKGLRKLEATPGDQLKKNTAKVRPEIPHIRRQWMRCFDADEAHQAPT